MNNIDFLIVIVYMLGMVCMGYFLGKDNEDQEDYFLAKRSMPWLPVGLSVAATMISANSFIGGPGWGYSSGIGPFMVNITVPFAILLGLTTFIPVFYNLKLTSVYEYSEKRLGPISRLVSVLGFLLNSLIQASSMVYIPALIIKTFTNLSIEVSVVMIVVIAIIYTLLGGIKAVVWTDAIQMVVLWGGLVFAVIFIFSSTGLTFGETIELAREAGKLDAIDFTFNVTSTNGFWATLLGGGVMWYRYFAVDQAQVQRILTSKSYKGVKNSFVTSAIIMNVLYLSFLMLGVTLFIYYKGVPLKSSNDLMINFIGGLPTGIVGIIIAGALAAAMSSVDSLLNSMTTVYTKDVHERFFKSSGDITSLKNTMIISTAFGGLIIVFVLIAFSGTLKSVIDVVGGYISYLSGPMLSLFILALFTKKANDKGVGLGVVLGLTVAYIIGKNFTYSWIWNPIIGFTITTIFSYVLSMFFKSDKSETEVERYTIWGQRREVLESGDIIEEGVSKLPLDFDNYSIALFGIFVIQYPLLVAFSRGTNIISVLFSSPLAIVSTIVSLGIIGWMYKSSIKSAKLKTEKA